MFWEIKTTVHFVFLSIEMHENRNLFKRNCPTTARASDAYYMLKSDPSIANQIREFCYSFDYFGK